MTQVFNHRIARLGCVLAIMVEITTFGRTSVDADPNVDATVGIAYDTVLKLASKTAPDFQAQSFRADFQAGMTSSVSCMPSVERRYVTAKRERIDEVCKQESTIVDCASRTVTMLDLQQRHYTRTSLDIVYDDQTAAIAADANRAGSTSTIETERSARGAQTSEGARTEAYAVVRTQTITSSSMSLTTRDSWTYEFLPQPLPALECLEAAAPWLSRYGAPQRYAPELQGYFAARFMKLAKLAGPRFQVTEHGPRLPDWRIPVYAIGEHTQTQSDAPAFTQRFEVESGNVHAIRSDDAIFTAPDDFTKIP